MTLIPELRAELHHAAGNVTASGARLRLLTEGKRRLVSTRTALVGGTVVLAPVVAAVVFVLSTASTKQSAWSRHALQQAAAVIIPKGSSNTILHISAVETFSPAEQRLRRHASEPVISKLTEQLWTREGDRGQERVILHVPGGPVLESDYTNTIYDRTNNTVYPPPQFPRSNPRYTLTPAADGGARLNVNLPGGGTYTQTLKAGVARKLRNGTDVALGDPLLRPTHRDQQGDSDGRTRLCLASPDTTAGPCVSRFRRPAPHAAQLNTGSGATHHSQRSASDRDLDRRNQNPGADRLLRAPPQLHPDRARRTWIRQEHLRHARHVHDIPNAPRRRQPTAPAAIDPEIRARRPQPRWPRQRRRTATTFLSGKSA
jgi:hypothetical protein